MESTPDSKRRNRTDRQPLEVYLRVRPLVKEERDQGQAQCFQFPESSTQVTISSAEVAYTTKLLAHVNHPGTQAQSYTHAQGETRFEFTRVFKP